MNIRAVCIFFCILLISSFLFIMVDKYLGTILPWVIIIAVIGGFLTFLFIKKTEYNVAGISLLVAFFTLATTWVWNYHNDRESKKLHHQHVAPKILCYVEYPLKTEGDKTFRNKRNPDIVVKNDGPIKAMSVTCDVQLYLYDEEKGEVVQSISSDRINHLISIKELEPFDQYRQSWIGADGDRVISVYHIKLIYHRQSDMEKFSQEQYFFIKQKKIMPLEQTKKDPIYAELINKVTSFDALRIPSQLTLTAANEHTWFAETDGSVANRIDSSGKLVIQTPEMQGEIPKARYPFLEITPRRWKASGCYIDANNVEGYLEVKILV